MVTNPQRLRPGGGPPHHQRHAAIHPHVLPHVDTPSGLPSRRGVALMPHADATFISLLSLSTLKVFKTVISPFTYRPRYVHAALGTPRSARRAPADASRRKLLSCKCGGKIKRGVCCLGVFFFGAGGVVLPLESNQL